MESKRYATIDQVRLEPYYGAVVTETEGMTDAFVVTINGHYVGDLHKWANNDKWTVMTNSQFVYAATLTDAIYAILAAVNPVPEEFYHA